MRVIYTSEEAHCLTNYAGGNFGMASIQTVASNGMIHSQILKLLQPYRKMGQ